MLLELVRVGPSFAVQVADCTVLYHRRATDSYILDGLSRAQKGALQVSLGVVGPEESAIMRQQRVRCRSFDWNLLRILY